MEWLLRMLSVSHADCVAWPFARVQRGYGAIKEDGIQHGVHRWVCEREHGPPPSQDHQAAHSCGNGHLGCINPAHLRWATPTENMADNIAFGRTSRGKPGPHRKLSPEAVREIRHLRGRVSQRDLGRRFGISPMSVSLIQRRKTWSWLD